jgi:hypothetical protein
MPVAINPRNRIKKMFYVNPPDITRTFCDMRYIGSGNEAGRVNKANFSQIATLTYGPASEPVYGLLANWMMIRNTGNNSLTDNSTKVNPLFVQSAYFFRKSDAAFMGAVDYQILQGTWDQSLTSFVAEIGKKVNKGIALDNTKAYWLEVTNPTAAPTSAGAINVSLQSKTGIIGNPDPGPNNVRTNIGSTFPAAIAYTDIGQAKMLATISLGVNHSISFATTPEGYLYEVDYSPGNGVTRSYSRYSTLSFI